MNNKFNDLLLTYYRSRICLASLQIAPFDAFHLAWKNQADTLPHGTTNFKNLGKIFLPVGREKRGFFHRRARAPRLHRPNSNCQAHLHYFSLKMQTALYNATKRTADYAVLLHLSVRKKKKKKIVTIWKFFASRIFFRNFRSRERII